MSAPVSRRRFADSLESESVCHWFELEVIAIFQHCPRQSRVLCGNRDGGPPVAPPLDQSSNPSAEAILFLAETGNNGSGAVDQQAAQISVASLRDAAPPRLAATAVLTGRDSDPGRNLSAVSEVVPGTDAGEQRTGRGWADAAQLHQPLATRVLARDLSDRTVVFEQANLDMAGALKQIADTALRPARQCVQIVRNVPAQPLRALWQHHAEFRKQAS